VDLVLIALWTAVYPTLLAAVLLIISMPEPRRLLTAFLIGGLIMSIGMGLLIVALLQGSNLVASPKSTTSWVADLAVGGLFVLVAVALARRADVRWRARHRARHPRNPALETKEPLMQRILARGSLPIVFLAGVVINVPGAAYLIGLKDIAAGHHAAGAVVFQVVLFNAIMFLIAEVTLFYLIFKPEKTDAAVKRMDRSLSEHGRQVGMALSASLGLFLIVRGIAHS
jgi:hypothetical protein